MHEPDLKICLASIFQTAKQDGAFTRAFRSVSSQHLPRPRKANRHPRTFPTSCTWQGTQPSSLKCDPANELCDTMQGTAGQRGKEAAPSVPRFQHNRTSAAYRRPRFLSQPPADTRDRTNQTIHPSISHAPPHLVLESPGIWPLAEELKGRRMQAGDLLLHKSLLTDMLLANVLRSCLWCRRQQGTKPN